VSDFVLDRAMAGARLSAERAKEIPDGHLLSNDRQWRQDVDLVRKNRDTGVRRLNSAMESGRQRLRLHNEDPTDDNGSKGNSGSTWRRRHESPGDSRIF